MKLYLNIAISLCKLTRTPVSFLLHPLDLIGGDKLNQLAFFPGMNIKSESKVIVFKEVIRRMMKSYNLELMSKMSQKLLISRDL